MSARAMALAFVGGTGKLGRGLGLRLAAAGHTVLIGSRSEDRAIEAAAALRSRLTAAGRSITRLEGASNVAAIPGADMVFLTLPYECLDTFLTERGGLLDGKIVVDVLNPLRITNGRFDLIPVTDGSAGTHVQRLVPRARVVSGFKNAAAEHLAALARPVRGDILLASDDAEAKAAVGDLVRDIPNLRAIDAGPLANAGFLESIAALELNLNRLHKTVTSIEILGID